MSNYELRSRNDEWGILHSQFAIRHLSILVLMFVWVLPVRAQVGHIVTIRPDRAAPGMNVVVELLTRIDDPRPFGYDALDSLVSVNLVDRADTGRMTVGPPIVSWNGRLIQIPIFVLPNATMGLVTLNIFSTLTGVSDTVHFFIDSLQHLGPITHDTTIGGNFGTLSMSNTMVVDSLIITNAKVHFSRINPNTLPGNPRLLPVVILSKGSVRLTNATIAVDADSVDGGSGGGGGGHGYGGVGAGLGGTGFTGGGSCPSDTLGSTGSDSVGNYALGGRAATGVNGGGSDPGDQGGGGGTGAPYGSSGLASIGASNSRAGGFGGGSGGGEAVNPFKEYGGGGGGFGTSGNGGGDPNGQGLNGGASNGGRFLVPLAGGSGGGAGNAVDLGDGTLGGSGGGGGGAFELIAFDSIVAVASNFSARGDSGTTGEKIAAGGGGGSGGAIYLASAKGIRSAASSINVEGGIAGRPAADSVGFAGGVGGLGRIRIDGPTNLTPIPLLSTVWTNGISLTPPQFSVVANGAIQLTGSAPDKMNALDTIRIFYRTQHTAWLSTDTVRNANGMWSKWLPLLHDSVLYVVAFLEVNQPASDPFNFTYEPSWLVSSASMAIVTHPASPDLVVQDTLNFGTVRIGRCKTLPLIIRNEGEAPLTIGKGTLASSPGFSIAPDTPVVLPPYASDTFQVQYCPNTAGADSDSLTFLSNDSANSPKAITLLGNGIARHDSLVLSPASVHFGKVLLGDCASDTVTLLSAGVDTLYLNQSVWNAPPFSMKLVPADTALAHNQKEKLILTFCPTDSGEAGIAQVLDERQDSIEMDGVGILRLAKSLGKENIGTICLGHTVTFTDTISNLGNDTITLESYRTSSPPQSTQVGAVIRPHERHAVAISWVPDSVGIFMDTISYQLSDTTLVSIVTYRVEGAELRFDSDILFPVVCLLGASDTDSVGITNSGLDSVVILQMELSSPEPFSLLDTAHSIIPGQTVFPRLAFSPQDTVLYNDTLRVIFQVAGCDSQIAIVLNGSGIRTGLAANAIHFDSILVDSCRTDSTLVANPCGLAAIIIDSVRVKNAAFKILSPLPDTIPALGSREVTFNFCPSVSGEEVDTVTFFPHGQQPFDAVLSGIGVTKEDLWAHFTISDAAVRAGDGATTSIRLDSSSIKGQHQVRVAISYDPEVVFFLSGSPYLAQPVGTDTIAFSGMIDFDTSGFIESVTWRALLGPCVSTFIGLSLMPDTIGNVIVDQGTVTITDCTGLNGHLSPGGNYSIGPITPDPASEVASFNLELGNDGYVEAGLYDMTGRLIEPILAKSYICGTYAIAIPMETLSSGHYMVEVNSLGWRAVRPFVVDR